jgi:hypothetical protein
MKKKIFIVILMAFLCSSLLTTSVFAATGVARVYYYTGTGANGPGTTSTINSYLTNMGYSSVRVADSGPAVVTLALSTSKVVHILAHGQGGTTPGGGIQCVTGSGNPSDWIWANNLSSSMSQAKLIFFECCYGACANPTNGRLDNKCISLGAQSTIAFTSEISAVGNTDGIHYFSRLVYYYLSLGNSVQSSVSSAQQGVWMYYGAYYGADNCVVNGGSTTIS